MPFLISFLVLLLNLVILGVIFWGICELVKAIPDSWIPAPAKTILLTILKVVVVIVSVVWVIGWLISILGGAGSFAVPMFYHRH